MAAQSWSRDSLADNPTGARAFLPGAAGQPQGHIPPPLWRGSTDNRRPLPGPPKRLSLWAYSVPQIAQAPCRHSEAFVLYRLALIGCIALRYDSKNRLPEGLHRLLRRACEAFLYISTWLPIRA